MTKYQRHPLSALFSRYDLAGEDLQCMADDIAANGQFSPITLLDGQILDGWNRHQACLLAKVKPVTIKLAPGVDPWEFVKGSNMLRRHMSPAERVAVMLMKMQMEDVPNGTLERSNLNATEPDEFSKLRIPTEQAISKDLEVSAGTAHKAATIAKAQDPELNQALADGKVSLAQAADIAKLPKEERHAALEAPPSPAKPAPDDRDARIEELTRQLAEKDAEIEDLRERLADTGALLKSTQEDLESRDRILDAEDLLAGYQKEVKANLELARVTTSRNNGLMVEVADLKQRLKSALRRLEKFEKAPAPIPLEVPA